MDRIRGHLHTRVLRYLAIVLALGAGGGYAIAATSVKTITVCADKKTGVLHLGTRCGRGQRKLSWNQHGPAGPAGQTGATGPAGPTGAQGPAAASVAALIPAGAGASNFGPADAPITVQHTGTGAYSVSVTASQCVSTGVPSQPTNVFTVTPFASGDALASVSSTAGGASTITVNTGVIASGGTYTPTDLSFELQDVCTK
jgi:hypothetical protein